MKLFLTVFVILQLNATEPPDARRTNDNSRLKRTNKALIRTLQKLTQEQDVNVESQIAGINDDPDHCRWFGTAWFCSGSCPADREEKSRSNKKPAGNSFGAGYSFGSNCWSGTKALCCKKWDGEAAEEAMGEQQVAETGTVKWYNDDKGFGFITRDSGGKDLFVHESEIESGGGYASLADGQAVSFDVGQGRLGPCATNVVALAEDQVGSSHKCNDFPQSTCQVCEGEMDFCNGKKYVITKYTTSQYSGLFGCSYPKDFEYVDSCPSEKAVSETDCPSDRIIWDTTNWSVIGCCDEGEESHWDGSCKAVFSTNDCPPDRIIWDMTNWSVSGCCDEGEAYNWDGSCKSISKPSNL